MSRQQLSDLDFLNATRILNLPQPVSPSEPARLADLNSAVEGLAWKDNVRAASVGNVTISNPGTSAFDGITLASNDRVLLLNQTTTSENGIYIFNGSAVPLTRSADASTYDELENAIVSVDEGATFGGSTYRQTGVNGTIGTTAITFVPFGASVPLATETVAGRAEIATQAETDAGTDDSRIVTPLKLANYAGRIRKFSQTFGDGTATQFTITHNLNTRDLVGNVYRTSGNFDIVNVDIEFTTTTTATIRFASAPATNAFRVVLQG